MIDFPTARDANELVVGLREEGGKGESGEALKKEERNADSEEASKRRKKLRERERERERER